MKLPSMKPDLLNLPFREHMSELVSKAGGSGTWKLTTGGAMLGAGFDAVSASKQERAFLSDMVEEYRPEIAERLGLSAAQVTQQHFNEVFTVNPVLAQAKDASKTGAKTRSISGVVSTISGMFAGLGAAAITRNAQTGDAQKNAGNIAGGLASTIGAMTAGRITRAVLGAKGKDHALKNTAHHFIMEIKDKQMRGEETTAADIFKVQLAVNPQLKEAIADQLGVYFDELDAKAQLDLMREEAPEVLAMNEDMAANINAGARPQGLLFGEVERVLPPVGPEVVEERAEAQPVEKSHSEAREQGQGEEKRGAEKAVKVEEFPDALEDMMEDVEEELVRTAKGEPAKISEKNMEKDIDPGFVKQLEQERERAVTQENAPSR